MIDIVEQLRDRAYSSKFTDTLLAHAADEIERLRKGALSACETVALTDAEREAIKVAESDYSDNDMDAGCWQIAATLRGLLERLK